MAKENSEIDLETYLTKPATKLQARFGDWIIEEVGYDPKEAKSKEEAFREGVRIATATRMVFQASDYNREATAAEREERAEQAEEAPKGKKAKAPEPEPVKAKAKKGKAAPVADEEEEAPKVKSKVGKGKSAGKGKGRRAAATADTEEEDAPF